MFYNDAIKEYGDITYKINKEYCEKYNLELILSKKQVYRARHPAWERLPLILNNLPKYDYLIWIDADAFFYRDAKDITEIIHTYPKANFIFSRDKDNKAINSGFFIVKNDEYSLMFLRKWAYDEKLYRNNTKPYWWDQGVLNDMVDKDLLTISKNSVCLDYGFFQHFFEDDLLTMPKPYIYHLAGRSHADRVSFCKEYYTSSNVKKCEN